MTEAVRILVAGIPAETVREIGLRLRDVVITDFENAQQMGRAAARGEARLVLLSDTLPTDESIYIARRARNSSDDTRIAYCISMQQAENALRALDGVHVDRFFLSPVDVEELLRALGKICEVEVLPPQAGHSEHVAAALLEAWDRTRAPTFQKLDKLDDAAIALLEDSLSQELKAAAERDARDIAGVAARYGFETGARVATEIGERFAATSLAQADGVSISGQLLALRQSLAGSPAAAGRQAGDSSRASATPVNAGAAVAGSQLEGRRVLIVDDEPMIARALKSHLERRGLVVTALSDPLRFWRAVDETKPDLILLDLEMPKINGTELCRAVRNDRRWSELSVLFLTGHTDQERVQRMFAAGADDYIAKPFVPAELMMRIESRLTGVKAHPRPVDTDPLTGLPTAGKATELIDRFLRLARRKSDPYSIAVLQVDSFPGLASTFGRTLSDIVLREIGGLLPKSFRAEDIASWWGGDDFTIGMYGSSKEHAAIKLGQVIGKIAELDFLAGDGRSVRVTCSGGVAQFQTDGDTLAALRDEALKALHQVRQAGGAIRVGISGLKPAGVMTRRVDVVIVDDDAALVSMLRHAMESRSLRVAAFADGESAATALTGHAPEVQAAVILLDVDLPALNGLDVLRRLNADGIMRSSSVVMLTARTGERDVLAALELGATDHIAKPFSVPVLMHKVRAVLKRSGEW
ncbi:MAG: response regulator [Gemmatimonadaceae bacterium]